jgi:hypothetical protein
MMVACLKNVESYKKLDVSKEMTQALEMIIDGKVVNQKRAVRVLVSKVSDKKDLEGVICKLIK